MVGIKGQSNLFANHHSSVVTMATKCVHVCGLCTCMWHVCSVPCVCEVLWGEEVPWGEVPWGVRCCGERCRGGEVPWGEVS